MLPSFSIHKNSTNTSTMTTEATAALLLNNDDKSIIAVMKSLWNNILAEQNSHDYCLYFDSIITAISVIIYFIGKPYVDEQTSKYLITGSIGVFVHGLGHGMLSKMLVEKSMMALQTDEYNTVAEVVVPPIDTAQVVVLLLFWLGLLKAVMNNVANYAVFVSSITAFLFHLMIPERMGFTYVQTVISVAFAITELRLPRSQKQFVYMTHSWIVVPVGFIGWIESMYCTAFVKDILGGHIIYDAYIPLASILHYFICMIYFNYNTVGDEKANDTVISTTTTKMKTL